jgi:ADP-dependent NAD(P)H-hydrate dehydratase
MLRITDALLRRWPLPDPAKGGSKEHRGRALIIAGADEMPGAAILASTAALRSGCGKVRVAVPARAAIAVGWGLPELFVLPIDTSSPKNRRTSLRRILDSAHAAAAVLIGPGMRDESIIRLFLENLLGLDSRPPLVVDAGALRLLPHVSRRLRGDSGGLILTPHHSEAATLCAVPIEKIERDPLRYAREIAERFRAVVVLKSAETLVSASPPSAAAYLNKRGNIGLATAGSGDVLAGMIAGLVARGADPLQAAVWSVALHARAGERLAKRIAPLGYLAHELIDEIPGVMARLRARMD